MTFPEELRDWSVADVMEFATGADPDEVEAVLRRLLADPDDRAVAVITAFLGASHGDVMAKPAASQLATRALLSLGPPGVDILVRRLLDADTRTRYRSAVLEAIWQVSRGRGLTRVVSRDFGGLLDLDLPAGTQEAAERAIRDIFAEALLDPDAFLLTSQFLHQTSMRAFDREDEHPTSAAELMGLFAEASIKLSRSVLDEFEALLHRPEREEEYQRFLANHLVLLEPLAAEVVPKQRLGVEYATDYAVRSHDGRWLLVEIERPHDRIFTQAGDFRERFTHAFGQVLDFQRWVDHNVAYAREHMAGITAPRGLVVIGMRADLSAHEQAKLQHFAENSRRIDIATFDDLLVRSRTLYENLRHRT